MMRDSTNSFGLVTIVLHWLCAIGIVVVLAIGFYVVYVGYYSRDFLSYAHLHYGLGLILLMLMSARILWRVSNVTPEPLLHSVIIRALVALVKFSLYILFFFIAVSGYFICTADGQTIDVLGIVEVPSIMLLDSDKVNIAGIIHRYGSWLFSAIIVLHIAAAIAHHFFFKDNTVKRMLRPK